MLDAGDEAPIFSLQGLDGKTLRFERLAESKPCLLVFFEIDCPTCLLTIPYLNRLSRELDQSSSIIGISQDGERPTRELVHHGHIEFPVVLDEGLNVTRLYDPVAVPTLFLIGRDGRIIRAESGFDKRALNEIATLLSGRPLTIAPPFDGAPETKFGCTSRHLEAMGEGELAPTANPYLKRGARASRIELDETIDPP